MMTAERLAEIRAGANNPTWSAGARLVATELLADIDHLAAEVERLRGAVGATPNVDDAMVERAAEMMATTNGIHWASASEYATDHYRALARRALTAALGEAARV